MRTHAGWGDVVSALITYADPRVTLCSVAAASMIEYLAFVARYSRLGWPRLRKGIRRFRHRRLVHRQGSAARCIYNRSARASFIAEAPTFSKNAARVISQICVRARARAPIAKDTDTDCKSKERLTQ